MKASLRWIKEFVDLPTNDAEVVAGVLSDLGIEVEGIERREASFSGVVVARVLAIKPHPAADKVRIATLDDGGEPIDVVCGAWNFGEGATVAYARVGAVLPGGITIGKKPVRGVMSPGMICSEIEMDLGEEKGGILVLPDGYAAPGTDFAGTLPYPDAIFDLSITPNRPDAMSIHGLARELGAFYELPVRIPTAVFSEEGATAARVIIEEPERCTRFTAREVRGVQVGPSPLWMRLRLRDAGVRPISNVVDVTNYVMLELGQPLHAFDLDRITDETIVVRLARAGEPLTTLDGVARSLSAEDLVIAGVDEPLGLAGIMGGGDSEVSAATTRVLIEVAHFEPTRVLLSGKRHGLRTEAVSRFERGVDPELPPAASARAASLMVEVAGGGVVGGFVDAHPRPHQSVEIALPVSEAGRLLGADIAGAEQAGYLRRLGFAVEGGNPLQVVVPSFRPDVTRPADLIEEIARLHGYDNFPSRLVSGQGGGLGPLQNMLRMARMAMVGAGFFEILSFDFIAARSLEGLRLAPDDPRSRPIRLRNPLNEEQEFLRTTLLPGLLDGLRRNVQRNRPDVALFEVGSVFLRGEGVLPEQPRHLAFAATGARRGRSGGDYEAGDAAGVAEVLLTALGHQATIVQAAVPGLHPGRAAFLEVDGRRIGSVGEIDPLVAAAWDLENRVVVGEFDLASLEAPAPAPFIMPSAYPPVVFDLAFDLAEEVAAAALLATVGAAAGPFLESLAIFDVFRGEPLGPGRKSVAVRLAFRAPDRTMVDGELGPIRRAISSRVTDDLGGRLRGG
ncbi:MAG: phenylalanine--tRNA ligase subunit beta [Actinobacteria bacterium RBG_16_68_21]|nr:MAG: phenylalanine--tRNA ligase subunit beta [Actinobacteria bacterium RBG_16_68_21]